MVAASSTTVAAKSNGAEDDGVVVDSVAVESLGSGEGGSMLFCGGGRGEGVVSDAGNDVRDKSKVLVLPRLQDDIFLESAEWAVGSRSNGGTEGGDHQESHLGDLVELDIHREAGEGEAGTIIGLMRPRGWVEECSEQGKGWYEEDSSAVRESHHISSQLSINVKLSFGGSVETVFDDLRKRAPPESEILVRETSPGDVVNWIFEVSTPCANDAAQLKEYVDTPGALRGAFEAESEYDFRNRDEELRQSMYLSTGAGDFNYDGTLDDDIRDSETFG